jgi:sulfide:quinone oxidoreductase
MRSFDIVIVGAGTAGIAVASRLARAGFKKKIAIVDPAQIHYYQPIWTLVGGGVVDKRETGKPMRELIPDGVQWIQEAVVGIHPYGNYVETDSHNKLAYDALIVASGIQLDWDKIPGLSETLGRHGVCSNYSFEHVDKTWDYIRSFQTGRAIFTQPSTPIKCGGAPQKIAYLAADNFLRRGLEAEVVFATAMPGIFPVEKYAKTLRAVIKKKKIQTRYRHELVSVNGPEKKALFRNLDTTEEVAMDFDMLHVTPPMSAPDFVKTSPIAAGDGWVDVNKHTLQHQRYKNVFALGDSSNLPTSKTGAAIRKQAPVVVRNVTDFLLANPLTASYDGYTSCPLVTGYGKLVLAEFDYDGNPAETFPFDQSKERLSMYMFKKYGLPKLYWQGMMKGRI